LPIYEYECSRCSSRFELKQSFSDDTRVSCPQCGGSARRIFSPAVIIFKGSGFYSTDNRGNHGHSQPTSSIGEAKASGPDEAKAGSSDEAITTSTEN